MFSPNFEQRARHVSGGLLTQKQLPDLCAEVAWGKTRAVGTIYNSRIFIPRTDAFAATNSRLSIEPMVLALVCAGRADVTCLELLE